MIYTMVNGRMTRTREPIRSSPQRANFVITCHYGDWSGFRTLDQCIAQFAELEKYYAESSGRRCFAVEER